MTDEPLVCPQCGKTYRLEERFCSACRMPLVVGEHDEEHLTEAQQRARKVKPQHARGEVSKVAMGRNQVEAELIQGILIEEGIPSIVRTAHRLVAAILAVLVAALGLSLLLLQLSS